MYPYSVQSSSFLFAFLLRHAVTLPISPPAFDLVCDNTPLPPVISVPANSPLVTTIYPFEGANYSVPIVGATSVNLSYHTIPYPPVPQKIDLNAINDVAGEGLSKTDLLIKARGEISLVQGQEGFFLQSNTLLAVRRLVDRPLTLALQKSILEGVAAAAACRNYVEEARIVIWVEDLGITPRIAPAPVALVEMRIQVASNDIDDFAGFPHNVTQTEINDVLAVVASA